MDDKPTGNDASKSLGESKHPGVSRRKFIGTMGAAAAAAAFLQRGGPAQAQNAQNYYYQDSFGNVAPAGQGAIQLGVYPPGLPSSALPPGGDGPDSCVDGAAGTTYYNCDHPLYHILLIMVDQMRNPAFWLPSGNNWLNSYSSFMPNLAGLAQKSFSFPNYWVAATICGPSRACLLTGLYTQQNCIFKSGISSGPSTTMAPPLLPYNPTWGSNNSSGNSTSNNSSPGFPTIGNVLSQSLPIGSSSNNASYESAWIGKWHVSCPYGNSSDLNPGNNGPGAYGFDAKYSIPTTFLSSVYPTGANGYPSPNGLDNEGAGGDFLDSQNNSSRDLVNFLYGSSYPLSPANWPHVVQLNDAAIAWAFTNYWLPFVNQYHNNAQATPWFCAVSFINPHDITDFPFAYALSSGNNYFTNTGLVPPGSYFQPPPTNSNNTVYYGNNCGNNTQCGSAGDEITINGFLPNNSSGAYANLPPGAGNSGPWNWEDLTSLPYSNMNNSAKPGLQDYWREKHASECGGIKGPGSYNSSNNTWSNPGPWQTFLNYYIWMQSCVDYQIGQVLGTNPNSGNSAAGYTGLAQYPGMANQTVVIFTSDHGDYGGSHGLHAKGGGLYEEAMNVPLFVSYPSMRNNATLSGPISLPYVCSGVDLLPFLYTLALGNHSWRTNKDDMVYYLNAREEINDAIHLFQNNSYAGFIHERRISGIPLYQGNNGCSVGNSSCNNWQVYQPFVLHTADDFAMAPLPYSASNNYQPSHAIAFRTVDITDPNNNSAPFYNETTYGGGKLGIYSYWDTCHQNTAPIMPATGPSNQYEFYNYSLHPNNSTLSANLEELGNQYFDSGGNATSLATLYSNDFFNNSSPAGVNVQNELYQLNKPAGSGNSTQQVAAAIQVAFQNYIAFLNCVNGGELSGNNNGGPVTSCSSACPNCNNTTAPCPPTYNP